MVRITLEEILGYSPLNTGGAEKTPMYSRKLFYSISAFIEKKERFIIAVDGLRRVGKTTLLKQLLNKLQKDGKTVFYFAFDKKAHQNAEVLEEILQFFIGKDDSAVVCLDEIGKIDDWGGIIKKYYDRSNTTFLISSSAALHIRKGKESLAGRMINYTLPPLGFDEYLALHGIEPTKALDFSEPECKTRFTEYLDSFMEKGSYPELRDMEDKEMVKSYIKNSVIEKMIFEDIPSIFKISHVSKLLEIYEYFSNYSGDFIHEKSISNLIGLSEPTVADYVAYLEQSHLVKRVFTEANYSKKIRKKKKGYVASPSIYFNTTSSFSQGKLIETAVFDKLSQYEPVTFLDEQKREVDFIVRREGKVYPIEVKSSDRVSSSDANNLVHYMQQKQLKTGYMIYRGPFDTLKRNGKTIYLIPLSSFLAAQKLIF